MGKMRSESSAGDEAGTAGVSIEDLRTVLRCYQLFRRDDQLSLNTIAERLSIDAVKLNRRIDRFEKSIQAVRSPGGQEFRIFDRKKGQKARLRDDPAVRQVMRDVADIVDSYEGMMSSAYARRTVIRVGMGVTLARYFVPLLSREFENIDFEVIDAKPRRLYELLREGRCDLALIDVPRTLSGLRQEDLHEFPMAVIAPRGHWTETTQWQPKDRVAVWSDLTTEMIRQGDTLCLLRETPDRFPMPDYPTPPQNLRVLRLSRTMLCLTMAMTIPNHLTIGLPQFLSGNDLERLHVVDVGLNPRFLALLSAEDYPALESERHAPRREPLVVDVKKCIRQELSQVKSKAYVPNEAYMYHLTRFGDDIVWTDGRLSWQAVSDRIEPKPEFSISGTYRVYVDGQRYRYAVRGRVVSNTGGDQQLLCRLSLMHAAFEDECALSCICPSGSDFMKSVLCGVWIGKAAWQSSPQKDFIPLSGLVVVSNEPLTIGDVQKRANGYQASLVDGMPLANGTRMLEYPKIETTIDQRR